MIFLLTGATGARNRIWQSEYTLSGDVIQKSPRKARGHNNLGLAYESMGRTEAAIAAYSRAIALNPGYFPARNNRGLLYARLARLEQAEQEFVAVLRLKPDYALERYRTGLEPNNETDIRRISAAFAHFNLALFLRDRGKTGQAAEQYLLALRFAPDYLDAHLNLGIAYGELGLLDKAISHLARAERLDPGNAVVHHNLAYALKLGGRTVESAAHLEQAKILAR
ncbi:MAG: hypothetical protein A2078_02680 [Nitrospirae bacterium GWC2_57_9]|nr:MAG: hypothetical protein A2078_02680 [Nitrospirae bacterium GWC2_57_9]